MARYKRWEQSFLKSLEGLRPVRHSRTPFRGERGVVCGECGSRLPSAHLFALHGGVCRRCWECLELAEGVVIDGWGG